MKRFILLATVAVLLNVSAARALQLGLHMDMTFSDDQGVNARAITLARTVYAKYSRNSFLWHKVEPEKGVRDWSRTDQIVNMLENARIEPIMCVYGSPAWASGATGSEDQYWLYVPTAPARFDAWLELYKDFMREAVKRYKGRVHKWELWNEENLADAWRPKVNLEQYVRWYKAIRGVILSEDPSAEVALGGLGNLTFVGEGSLPGYQFLEMLYEHDVYPDIVAIHPYTKVAPDQFKQWDNNFDDINLIHRIMESHGQSGRPLWVTEWGWSSAEIGEQLQAVYLKKSIEMLRSRFNYVSLAIYFLDWDRPPNYYFGLFTTEFISKPAAFVFAEQAKALGQDR
jgi:hypothetical protein